MQGLAIETEQQLQESGEIEATLVELVISACELTEDEGEVMDLVDGLIEMGRVHLLDEELVPVALEPAIAG